MIDNNMNDELFDRQIQKMVEGYREAPSDACWDQLAHHLDNITSPVHTSPHAGGKMITSWVVKAVIPVVAVAGVAAGIALYTSSAEKENIPAGNAPVVVSATRNAIPSAENKPAVVPPKDISNENSIVRQIIQTENNESEVVPESNAESPLSETKSTPEIPHAKDVVQDTALAVAPAREKQTLF